MGIQVFEMRRDGTDGSIGVLQADGEAVPDVQGVTAGRVVQLRRPRSDRQVRSKNRRLYIRPPLEVGDSLVEPGGFRYRLVAEFMGEPKSRLTKWIYETRRKGEAPRVLIWHFNCADCGRLWSTMRVASAKPTAKKCLECKQVNGPRIKTRSKIRTTQRTGD